MSQENRIVVHGITPSLKVQDKNQLFKYDEHDPITRLELTNQFETVENLDSINSLAFQHYDETGFKIYTRQEKEVDNTTTPATILYKKTLYISTYQPQLNETTNLVEETDTNLIELDSSALKVNTSLDVSNHRITNVATPIEDTDAVNRYYVDHQTARNTPRKFVAHKFDWTYRTVPVLYDPVEDNVWAISRECSVTTIPPSTAPIFYAGYVVSLETQTTLFTLYLNADNVYNAENVRYRTYPFVYNNRPALLFVTGSDISDYHAYISVKYPTERTIAVSLPSNWFDTVGTDTAQRVFPTPVGTYISLSTQYVILINISDLDNITASDISIIGEFALKIVRVFYVAGRGTYFQWPGATGTGNGTRLYLNSPDNEVSTVITFVDDEGYGYSFNGYLYWPDSSTIRINGNFGGGTSYPTIYFKYKDNSTVIACIISRRQFSYAKGTAGTDIFMEYPTNSNWMFLWHSFNTPYATYAVTGESTTQYLWKITEVD